MERSSNGRQMKQRNKWTEKRKVDARSGNFEAGDEPVCVGPDPPQALGVSVFCV